MAYFFYAQAREHGFDWRVFARTLEELRWSWLGAALLLAFTTYYGRALRWAVLLRPVRPKPGMWNLFSATAIGFTAVTLLGRPGEFVRPYLIASKERVSFSSQLAAWMLERIYDLLIALLVFGYALGQVQQSDVKAGLALSWVLAFGGRFVAVMSLVCLTILLLIRHFAEPMRRRLLDALAFLPARHFQRVEELVNAFVQGVESTRSRSAVLLLIFYTVLEWLLIAACYYCVAKAYGSALQFGLVDILIFMGFVSFGAVIQIPGIGGGVQMVSIVVLTELFALPLEVATSVAVVLWAVTFVVIVPFGLALAFHDGIKWSRLKHIRDEAAP